MSQITVKVFAVVLSLAGLVALVTGIGGVEYAFQTSHWSISEAQSSIANRIVGGVLLVFGVLLFRLMTK